MNTHTPAPWNWHDSAGRKNGEGKPIGTGRGITGDVPEMGNLSRFSFAVSDNTGLCVAHCTNALVTMSTERSEANARLIAAAPDLLAALMGAQSALRKALPFLPPDNEYLYVGEWLDEVNEAIAKVTA